MYSRTDTQSGPALIPQYMENHGMLLEEHDQNMHPKPHTKLYPIFVPSKTMLNGDIPVTPIGRDGRRDDVGPDPEWEKKSAKLYWVSHGARDVRTGLFVGWVCIESASGDTPLWSIPRRDSILSHGVLFPTPAPSRFARLTPAPPLPSLTTQRGLATGLNHNKHGGARWRESHRERLHFLAFDALVLPRHLAPLRTFAERHPALRIVIDHGAKPEIARGRFADWRRDMAALAAFRHVSVKLSGLLTEAGGQPPVAVRPYAETLLDLFGPDRVLWGSDWPVLRLAGEYQTWLDQCRDIVPAEHHDAVFGANAVAFYRLGA